MTTDVAVLMTTETDRIIVVARTTTSRTDEIRATTDKVNNITASPGDDGTQDPQTSRGPKNEAVGPGVEASTMIIPRRLRHCQEAVLVDREEVYHLSL
jgi:hypothetical protein